MDRWMESSSVQKDFKVLVDDKLDISQPHALTTQKSIHVLGCIRSVTSRLMGGILPLCFIQVTSCQCCLQHYGPQGKTDVDPLEQVQRRPQRCLKAWSLSAMKTGWKN